MTIDVDWLRSIVEQDEFGLLVAPVKVAPPTADERVVASFQEICSFIEKQGHPPTNNPADVSEFQLYHRLQAFLGNSETWAALAPYDVYGLLTEPEPPESIDEILGSDVFGLLDSPGHEDAPDIFTLRHVPAERAEPDDVAERQPCPDFERFEPLFKDCHSDLRVGRRSLIQFRNESQISADTFYVVRGILAYVAEVGEESKVRGRRVARLRCIFENGTESNLLLQSLARSLYDNGRRVTEPNDVTLARMGFEVDAPQGEIYVLRSLSDDPHVQSIPHLHKIGFTKGTTDERIAHAEQQRTYLNAPVQVIATYGTPAVTASNYEALIHRFFAAARIDVAYVQAGETVTTANEWFSVPLPVIDEAIQLLSAGSITNYEYDRESGEIHLRH